MHRTSVILAGIPTNGESQPMIRPLKKQRENRFEDISMLLNSSDINDKSNGMRKLVNLMAKGRDVVHLFAEVVKNVSCPSLEVRKLVYSYLVRYTYREPDLALLAVNTFQNDLSDPNPLIRGMAMRVLCGISIPDILPIVILAVQKCARDQDPYVRKMAALSLIQLFCMDKSILPQLKPVVRQLLNDESLLVIGSAIASLLILCPDEWEMVHKQFRKLCRMMTDMREHDLVLLLELMTRYVRLHFTKPSPETTPNNSDTQPADLDYRLFLDSVVPLLHHSSTGVIFAVVETLLLVAPVSYRKLVVHPMLRILKHGCAEIQTIGLVLVHRLIEHYDSAELFRPHVKRFYVFNDDEEEVASAKFKILFLLTTDTTVRDVLEEAQEYSRGPNTRLVCQAIKFTGKMAQKFPEITDDVLFGLTQLIELGDELVSSTCIAVTRELLLTYAEDPAEILTILARSLSSLRSPKARSCIFWLLAHFCDRVPAIIPDVLQLSLKNFTKESISVKLQILNLAVRAYMSKKENFCSMLAYTLQLCRYDRSYDLRDRARFYRELLFGPSAPSEYVPTELSNDGMGLLSDGETLQTMFSTPKLKLKQPVQESSPTTSARLWTNLSIPVPEWATEPVEGSIRDVLDPGSEGWSIWVPHTMRNMYSMPALSQSKRKLDGSVESVALGLNHDASPSHRVYDDLEAFLSSTDEDEVSSSDDGAESEEYSTSEDEYTSSELDDEDGENGEYLLKSKSKP